MLKTGVSFDHVIESIVADVTFEKTQVDDFCDLGTETGGMIGSIPRND